jgi:PIN domain nuclease of toxin-antitoxin system
VILDAYALIAYLAGERAADEVEQLLRGGDDPPAISPVNAGEVVDRLTRVAGHDLNRVLRELLRLRDGGLEILTVDAFDGLCAGALRQRFYDRRHAPLSLADCAALTAAVRHGQRLATADAPLATAARAMSLDVAALPDSSGVRPE